MYLIEKVILNIIKVKKNQELNKETKIVLSIENESLLKEEETKDKNLCLFIGMKVHHLLRTNQRPGILSLQNTR